MPEDRRRLMMLALAALALAGLVFLTQRFVAWSRLQECLASGRRDCVTIEVKP